MSFQTISSIDYADEVTARQYDAKNRPSSLISIKGHLKIHL